MKFFKYSNETKHIIFKKNNNFPNIFISLIHNYIICFKCPNSIEFY